MTMTQMTPTTNAATALHARLAQISLADVPTSGLVRCDRSGRAAAARALFRRLGLKKISVTAPEYSMAQSVDVRLPRSDDGHDRTKWPHRHTAECCGTIGGHNEGNRCPACRDHAAAERKVEAILFAAFPNCRDKSRTQEDYYSYCWSLS